MIRNFLRFLAADGVIAPGLESQIDSPRVYRQEQLPRALPWTTVQAFSVPSTERVPSGNEITRSFPSWRLTVCVPAMSSPLHSTTSNGEQGGFGFVSPRLGTPWNYLSRTMSVQRSMTISREFLDTANTGRSFSG